MDGLLCRILNRSDFRFEEELITPSASEIDIRTSAGSVPDFF